MKLILVVLILSMVSCGSVRHNRNVQTQLEKCTERRTLLLLENDLLDVFCDSLQRVTIKDEQTIYNLEYTRDSLTYIIEMLPFKFSANKYKRGRLARRKDF